MSRPGTMDESAWQTPGLLPSVLSLCLALLLSFAADQAWQWYTAEPELPQPHVAERTVEPEPERPFVGPPAPRVGYGVAIGYNATACGNDNVIIGADAVGIGYASGANNVFIGYAAGEALASDRAADNTCIGTPCEREEP